MAVDHAPPTCYSSNHVHSEIKALGEQLRLTLRRAVPMRRETFVVSACNADAVARLDAWPRWTAPAKALVGPEGSGKTHLATAWAARTCAALVRLENDDIPEDGPVVVEDADRGPIDERLFHLLNRAGDPAHAVLLTARTLPAQWETALPDLRSRLNALQALEIGEPDDGVLAGVLRRRFNERAITPAPELIAYLAARIERSAPAAEAMVERLEAAASALHRPINRALARTVLSDVDANAP
jgi:chromosomal replication initiation ATPase DnaA